MTVLTRPRRLLALLAVVLTLSALAVDGAEARRGGSFGSRGMRTFQAPPVTTTAPRPVAPVERTMTPRTGVDQTGAVRPGSSMAGATGGMFGGFGRSMVGGLLLGGLFGMLLGHGFGGGVGFLGLILQIGLILLGVSLLMRVFRSRSEPAYASGQQSRNYGPTGPLHAGAADVRPAASAGEGAADAVGLTAADFDAFERLLGEIQDAYAREDFPALRARTTPEVMGYLAEELSANATRGLRNDVAGTKLLQGDLAEAWREAGADYATVALRYESVDVMRERASGRVVEGDPDRPTEAREIWTFVRRAGEDWILSAIQEA